MKKYRLARMTDYTMTQYQFYLHMRVNYLIRALLYFDTLKNNKYSDVLFFILFT